MNVPSQNDMEMDPGVTGNTNYYYVCELCGCNDDVCTGECRCRCRCHADSDVDDNREDDNREKNGNREDDNREDDYEPADTDKIDEEGPADEASHTFQYINCLGRDYDRHTLTVRRAEFPISRYSMHSHCLDFESPTSEAEAIAAIEKYLSAPLTEDYFKRVCDDLFGGRVSWKRAQKQYRCRGGCLSDARYLEKVTISADGKMAIFTGS